MRDGLGGFIGTFGFGVGLEGWLLCWVWMRFSGVVLFSVVLVRTVRGFAGEFCGFRVLDAGLWC